MPVAITTPSQAGFVANLGTIEVVHASGAGAVSFSQVHGDNVVVLQAATTSAVVTAVTKHGCSVDAAATLIVIG